MIVILFTLALAAEDPLRLAIGDPARRDREAPLVLDGITESSSSALLTPEDLARRLKDVRVVFLGESHTNMDFHRVQLRVIESLVASGRNVLVGLEMYPYTEQAYLDQWIAGLLTERGFLELSHWYKNWGYHWGYYRDILLFAKERGVPLVAVNTPREVVSAVRKKGFQNLTAEEKAHLPPRIDTENAEHFQLFKAFFDDDDEMHGAGMTDDQWRTMFAAQCTWDATMGFNAVEALKRRGDPSAIMVVLIGSGHVAYGLGAERQAALWFDGKMASVIPVPVVDAKKKAVESVRASYADFIWGVPQETSPLYPALGISFGSDRLEIIHVEKDSAGEQAGFKVGDVVRAMDRTPLPDKESFNRRMAEKSWGDAARFEVVRGSEAREVVAYLRRSHPRF